MLRSALLTAAVVSLGSALPQFPVPSSDGTSGGGPYPANYSVDAALPGHTIYAPLNPGNLTLPVILWGNGGCIDQGLGFRNFLNHIASYGYFVVANGAPEGSGISTNKEMEDSLAWVLTKPRPYLDTTNIAASGQSCGGFEAYDVAPNPAITLVAMFDSGNLLGNFDLNNLHTPVGYFLGGTSDIAWNAGTNDYSKLPAKVPGILINNPTGGHLQTYMDKEGGISGVAAVAFFDWLLKKEKSGYQVFTDPNSQILKAGWKISMKNFPTSLTTDLSSTSATATSFRRAIPRAIGLSD